MLENMRSVKLHPDPELSAQVQAPEPPDSLYESIIPTMEPYVPAIIKKVPARTTNELQATPNFHVAVRCSFQLSYSHMQPIG